MTIRYQEGIAWMESVSLEKLAQVVGTPAYCYSSQTLLDRARAWKEAFRSYPTLSCFAVKANACPKILELLSREGLGADVVSGGELELALSHGFPAEKILFSGVGKTRSEIKRALEKEILCLNVESAEELEEIVEVASALKKKAPIALRLNPDIDPHTHPHIATGLAHTKFGMDRETALKLVKRFHSNSHLEWKGIACHLGSQIVDLNPFREAARQLVSLAQEFSNLGVKLRELDLGGGLGIRYEAEEPPKLSDYAKTLHDVLRPTHLRLLLEPGRILVAEAGILLTRVIRVKRTIGKTFVVVDAGMNDLLRPALYGAYHRIEAVREGAAKIKADVVGPICETTDTLGFERQLPDLKAGDLLMIREAGAYGATMSSTYNARPLTRQVWIEGKNWEST